MSSVLLRYSIASLSEQEWEPVGQAGAVRDEELLSSDYQGKIVIRSHSLLPSWFSDVIVRFQKFLKLENNWDSYNAKRINRSIVDAAIEFLAMIVEQDSAKPTIVPTSIGGVQIEWFVSGVEIEIEFLSADTIQFFSSIGGKEDEWEGKVGSASISRIAEIISRFCKL